MGRNDALYVFTIDLDQLIFWVCGQPVFNLANMPQGGEFVNYSVSADVYLIIGIV